MSKFESFQAISSKYAAILGRKLNVKVRFGGDVAFTDGKVINIPALPSGTVMTKKQKDAFIGYLDHEAGHVRFTDFADFAKPESKKDPVLQALVNLFEDIRIENRMIDFYPGARHYLDELCFYVDQQVSSQVRVQNAAAEAFSLIYKEAYVKYRNVDTKVVAKSLSDFPEFLEIMKVMSGLDCMKTTEDAYQIALKVRKLLPEVKYEQKDLTDALSQMMGEMSQEAKQALEQAFQQLDSHQAKQVFVKDLQTEIKVLNDKLVNHKDKPPVDNPLRAKRRFKLSNRGKVILPPVSTAGDKIFVPAKEDIDEYVSTRNHVRAEITATKKMLYLYLRSRNFKAWTRCLPEGDLDETRLHLVPGGEMDVFKTKIQRTVVNTALELMVDCSKSMNQDLTKVTAIMLAEALSQIPGLKLEITGFTTNSILLNSTSGMCGRAQGIDLLVFKGFDTPYEKSRARLGALTTSGSTPLGDAYGLALERIIQRNEPRKIIWIISDGDPQIKMEDYSHSEYLLMDKVRWKAKKLGVETVGLFVGDPSADTLKGYVEKCFSTKSISQLPHAVLQMTKGLVETKHAS